MGTLVSSYFAFGTHAEIFSLGCGSPLNSISMTLRKSFILLLIFFVGLFLGTPLCQVVIALSWVFLALFSLMLASLTLIISYIARSYLMSSQVEPFYISFAAWFPIFLPKGEFPLSVIILHMFPCLEHRYIPLLGTSLFSPWHSSPPIFVTIKHFYSFFKLFKIFEKVQKIIKKPKIWIGKDVNFGNSRVMSPSNRSLYFTSVGWVNSLNLEAVLVSLSLSPPTG